MQFARVMISNVLPVTSTVLKCVSYRCRVTDVLLGTKTALQMYCELQLPLHKCLLLAFKIED